jgi:hypothetical protein
MGGILVIGLGAMLFLAFVLFIGIFMLAMAVHGADALTHGPGQSQSHH